MNNILFQFEDNLDNLNVINYEEEPRVKRYYIL